MQSQSKQGYIAAVFPPHFAYVCEKCKLLLHSAEIAPYVSTAKDFSFICRKCYDRIMQWGRPGERNDTRKN